MIEVTEHIGGHFDIACGYDDLRFVCPMCDQEQEFNGQYVAFCYDCHADLLDVSEVVDDEEYRIEFHFGIIGYDGEKQDRPERIRECR